MELGLDVICGIQAEITFLSQKPLYRSRAGNNFFVTDIEIWAGFGPVGSIEIKFWANYERLLRAFFSCFHGQKNVYLTKKLHFF
jgi:hypothetical protein